MDDNNDLIGGIGDQIAAAGLVASFANDVGELLDNDVELQKAIDDAKAAVGKAADKVSPHAAVFVTSSVYPTERKPGLVRKLSEAYIILRIGASSR